MRVLIVDDNEINRKLLRVALIAEGLDIVEAFDGVEALATLKQEKVDVIISDILMPNMDGYRLCVEIRKSSEFGGIPLIFYTSSYTFASDEKFGLEVGADKFIRKPASIKVLLAAIDEVVEKSKKYLLPIIEKPAELDLLKTYNERLISKLEQKNAELEYTKESLLATNQELIKRTEALQKSEREIREIFENIQDIFYRTDNQGIISMISLSVERYGYKVNELIGNNVGIIYTNLEEKELFIKTLKEKRSVEDLEVKLKNKNGNTFYASTSARLLVNNQGKPIGVEGFLRDISQRKLTEQCLEIQYTVARLLAGSDSLKSVALKILQIICENLGWDIGGLWLTQPNAPLKHIETWQSPILTNIEKDEFSKVNQQIIFSYNHGILGHMMATAKPIWRTDLAHANKDFLRFSIATKIGLNSMMGFPIMLGEEVSGIIEFFSREIKLHNIDLVNMMIAISNQVGQFIERKHAELQLQEERALLAKRVEERTSALSFANNQLERVNKLKDEFLASMSHELRTPLNAILGLSEALQEEVYGTLTEKQRKSLNTIEESGRHLLELINDILDLSKIEAGKLEVQLGLVSIDLVCQASICIVKEAASKKQIRVFTSSDNVATTLQADERRLKQILVNLLINAVKFTPNGGQVGLEIASEIEKQKVRFTVWDTGIGISKENLSQLFQPFVQLDSSLARQHSGTGLGLVLVKRMVELLGGSISVESEVDKGSRFTVLLPWNSNKPSLPSGEMAIDSILEKITVKQALIIEDNPTHSEQIARYLTAIGAEVNIYPQGKDIVDIASKSQPDVILLDIELPDISGWDVLKGLKSQPLTKEIPVVIISVIDEQEYGMSLGAANFLVKPVSRLQVLNSIKKAIVANGVDSKTKLEEQKDLPLILLVEDNEINIDTISEYLIAKKYKIIVARNGSQAIEIASEKMPNLILMDIQMPNMDGLEATQLIRSNQKLAHIPIIAITALAMPGDRERCIAAGANAYISKPVKLKELVKLIQEFLP